MLALVPVQGSFLVGLEGKMHEGSSAGYGCRLGFLLSSFLSASPGLCILLNFRNEGFLYFFYVNLGRLPYLPYIFSALDVEYQTNELNM